MLVPSHPVWLCICVCVWKCVCVSRVHGYVRIYEDVCCCTGCSYLLLYNLVLWRLSFIIIFFADLGVDERRGKFPWASPVWVQSGWSWDWSPSRPPSCMPRCWCWQSVRTPPVCPELGHSGAGFPGQEPRRKWLLGLCCPFWQPWGMCSLLSTVCSSLAAG